MLTQPKVEGQRLQVGVSVDNRGVKSVNGIPVLKTIEATNGRIYLIDGMLEPGTAPVDAGSDFSDLLGKSEGYQMMAEIMDSEQVRKVLETSESVTVLAAPDEYLSAIKGGQDSLIAYAIESLIIPGRYDTSSFGARSAAKRPFGRHARGLGRRIWTHRLQPGKLTIDNYSRDHHPRNYSIWMAGGGIKQGHTHGTTDDFSYNIVEDSVAVFDLNATILHLMGINHKKLTYRYQGRDFRLTDVHGRVVEKI